MDNFHVDVDPGICGFLCRINVKKTGKRIVRPEIAGSECKMIQKFSALLEELSLKDLFLPLTKNPIFISAERAGCHLACPVPVAVVKASEAALDLALKKDVTLRFSDGVTDDKARP